MRQDRALIKLAKEKFGVRKIVAMEVGVLHGGNAVSILKNLNIEKLYLVDPYLDYKEYRDSISGFKFSQFVYDEMYKTTKNRMRKYGDKVILIREKSENLDIKEKFDFIYLDANYDNISNDFKKFFPMLKKDGILGGYAFSGNHRKFVEELIFLIRQYDLTCCFGGDYNEWWIT